MESLDASNPESKVDLTNCDHEPIHIPGAILPHGALLVVDPRTEIIEQAAGKTEKLLGQTVEGLIGRALESVLGKAGSERVRALSGTSDLRRPRHLLDPILRVFPDCPLDASAHISGGSLVLEFEDADLADRHALDPLACVQEMLDGLEFAPSLAAFCQMAADRVRAVARYDRVMIYRFMPDESGWVFAESKRDDLVSFLDLHYPASDIPRQARALYVTSPIRLITQVDYDPAPLTPSLNPRTREPLDMSQAVLRDVSPIHREYLRNMGVDASMSISIVREGKLWGLIACHNMTPRLLARHLRAICELFGSMFSLQLEARQRVELFEARLQSSQGLSTIMHQLAGQDDYAAGLVEQAANLLNYISAGGVALRTGQSRGGVAIRVNDGIIAHGQTPTEEQIGALTDWLTHWMKDGEGIFVTDRLAEMWPQAEAFANVGSGLLAISVSREPRDFILWFRPEVVETVSWGGDPTKPVEIGPNGARLTPRKSFEAWTLTVRGRSTPWAESDNDAAFDLRVSLLEVVLRRIDAAARERLRAWEHERLLMAELDHRVKNMLANIQSLVTLTSRSATSLSDFTEGLNRRIRAMSRAHSLLTESRWEGVSIASLVHEELDPYQRINASIVQDGPEVVLTPKAALALSLALHELATNAAKFGALSIPGGWIAVEWRLDGDGGVALAWTERGGPPVSTPERRGFGSTLIERALSMETGGRSKLSFAPEGVVCDLALNASSIQRLGRAGEVAKSIA